MRPDEGVHVRELVNAEYAEHDGFAPIDEALWRWHYIQRPTGRPARTYVLERDDEIAAAATFGEMEMLLAGRPRRLSVAFDLAARTCGTGPALGLLCAAPTEAVALLLDERAPESEACLAMGMQRHVGEVAMVLPFSERARAALEQEARIWYVMVESVVGV